MNENCVQLSWQVVRNGQTYGDRIDIRISPDLANEVWDTGRVMGIQVVESLKHLDAREAKEAAQ